SFWTNRGDRNSFQTVNEKLDNSELTDLFTGPNAPELGGANISFALTNLDPAPAVAALVDATHHARLGEIGDAARRIRPLMQRARFAGSDDSRSAIAQQADQHPTARSVRILDHSPIGIGLDHPDRQVAPLVQPYAGII